MNRKRSLVGAAWVVFAGLSTLAPSRPAILGGLLVSSARAESPGKPGVLIRFLEDELEYAMANLEGPGGTKPYFLNYAVYDERRVVLVASGGAILRDHASHHRNLNTDLRVGDYEVDNTHQLRGQGAAHERGGGNIALPLEDDADAIRQALWYHTDRQFKRAVRRFDQVKTNLKVKVAEEDRSHDFSRADPHVYFEDRRKLELDRKAWADRLRRLSRIAREYPLIYESRITVGGYAALHSLVSSEGTRLQTAHTRYRVTLTAETTAEDGMALSQSFDFNARDSQGLPGERDIAAAFRRVIAQVLALREAPLAEPYTGPAILRNRASGVFFHEIFGHRIEGHRQRDVTEGQTFTKKVGEQILPPFIDVFDDPTKSRQGRVDLRGAYRFDDEGVRARPVRLVNHGVLETFLFSRKPIEGFPVSNGHGRRQAGYAPISRQANLLVTAEKSVPFDQLRRLLVDECAKQEKPYGLLFEDISGGFTTTNRRGPQSFKVLPIVVYRVFPDGRPDELIRGADMVGTPLASFAKILATGDDPAVFNGSCGAESGWVPVSAVSPSILVSSIEIEKRSREQSRPPILEPPPWEPPEETNAAAPSHIEVKEQP